jgi:hypothetical protein
MGMLLDDCAVKLKAEWIFNQTRRIAGEVAVKPHCVEAGWLLAAEPTSSVLD